MPAFATTVVQNTSLGSLKATYGRWTVTSGQAAGTFAVEGGNVLAAFFTSIDSSGAVEHLPRWSVSVSGNVSTITVYHTEDVTAGRFLIIYS